MIVAEPRNRLTPPGDGELRVPLVGKKVSRAMALRTPAESVQLKADLLPG